MSRSATPTTALPAGDDDAIRLAMAHRSVSARAGDEGDGVDPHRAPARGGETALHDHCDARPGTVRESDRVLDFLFAHYAKPSSAGVNGTLSYALLLQVARDTGMLDRLPHREASALMQSVKPRDATERIKSGDFRVIVHLVATTSAVSESPDEAYNHLCARMLKSFIGKFPHKLPPNLEIQEDTDARPTTVTHTGGIVAAAAAAGASTVAMGSRTTRPTTPSRTAASSAAGTPRAHRRSAAAGTQGGSRNASVVSGSAVNRSVGSVASSARLGGSKRSPAASAAASRAGHDRQPARPAARSGTAHYATPTASARMRLQQRSVPSVSPPRSRGAKDNGAASDKRAAPAVAAARPRAANHAAGRTMAAHTSRADRQVPSSTTASEHRPHNHDHVERHWRPEQHETEDDGVRAGSSTAVSAAVTDAAAATEAVIAAHETERASRASGAHSDRILSDLDATEYRPHGLSAAAQQCRDFLDTGREPGNLCAMLGIPTTLAPLFDADSMTTDGEFWASVRRCAKVVFPAAGCQVVAEELAFQRIFDNAMTLDGCDDEDNYLSA